MCPYFLRISWASSMSVGSFSASSFSQSILNRFRSFSRDEMIPTRNQMTPSGKHLRVISGSRRASDAITSFPDTGIPCRVRKSPGSSLQRLSLICRNCNNFNLSVVKKRTGVLIQVGCNFTKSSLAMKWLGRSGTPPLFKRSLRRVSFWNIITMNKKSSISCPH